MKNISAAFYWLLSSLLLLVLVVVLYPLCRYGLLPDDVACLAIVRRYATGDLHNAINAYWSPLSCWLSALLVKGGMALIPAAVTVNTAAGLGVLLAAHLLFRFFEVERRLQGGMQAVLAIFLAYAVYVQLFADLWEVFFLLLQLRLLLDERFLRNKSWWVWYGCLGGLAYYAKAYAFPFFLLQTAVIGWLRFKEHRRQWPAMMIVCCGVMLAWALPWIWLLHERYGRWMTSSAGDLNLSWYLVGHPYFKEEIGMLLPPPSADAPFYWEDPGAVNGPTPKFYSSGKLFLLQIVRSGVNVLKFLDALVRQSAFMVPVYVAAAAAVFSQRFRVEVPGRLRLLAVSMLLFPLGFWLINFESRYIWYLLPCGMTAGAWLLQKITASALRRWLIVAFVLSFAVWPLWELKSLVYLGRADHETAQLFRQQGVQGSFSGNAGQGEEYRSMARLAWFSGNQYYYMLPGKGGKQELLAELRRYRIQYYFHLHRPEEGQDFRFSDEQGRAFPEVAPGVFPGMQVFRLRP